MGVRFTVVVGAASFGIALLSAVGVSAQTVPARFVSVD